ncbi:PD40 domain-containing protein, partial [bacterium]|nr:PD40 domain-containing protein [bacterium]
GSVKLPLRLLFAILALVTLSCKVGRRPLGVVYVLKEEATSRAYYLPLLGDEGLRFGDRVELPFTGPVDQLAITPDGGELWAWAGADEGDPALWSLAFTGDRFGEPELRFDLSPYPAGLASAAVPLPDSVVFDALEPVTGRWQIFRLDRDGLVQLTPGEADCQSPTLSPDGAFIVFSSNRDGSGGAKGDWGLWGYEFATGSVCAIYDTSADEGSPWFAPDGSLFYNSFEYVEGNPVGSILRLHDPQGLEVERLSGIEGILLFPRPSPDGEWLLITTYTDPTWMTLVVNLETHESWSLGEEEAEITFACWR